MASFRFSPEILRRLGEELVPNVDQGIVELVRNAYDADASHCTVTLIDILEPGGELQIEDDGCGMSDRDIQDGWLILGRSEKAVKKPTQRFHRVPVGDKGLGRLSALRLGETVVLRTRPFDEPGIEFKLRIDWASFDTVSTVEEVRLRIEKNQGARDQGTTIRVSRLRQSIQRREAEKIARSLLLLANPFTHQSSFSVKLKSNDFPDLVKRVDDAYFAEADIHLKAWLDTEGKPHAVVRDKTGRELHRAEPPDISDYPYVGPEIDFELWEFDLSGKSFAPGVAKRDIQEWLTTFGGVHVYIRDLRVAPYGDRGNDWLEMNLARSRSPELRPSTNNSIGRVHIKNDEALTQKTDRSGFIEDDAFFNVRRFAIDVLNWMSGERLSARDARIRSEKAAAPERITSARSALTTTLRALPPNDRKRIEAAVNKLDKARDDEAQTLKEELQLYRTLATVGTSAAVFAHESAQPVTKIERSATLVAEIATSDAALFDRQTVMDLSDVITRAAKSLRTFASLPIELLRREKRRRGLVSVHPIICDVKKLFDPFLEEREISLHLELDAYTAPTIRGSVAAIESILANLITNAAHSLIYSKVSGGKRIIVRTFVDDGSLFLTALDNGAGLVGIELRNIWIAGKSTRNGGTGLGLTIVRDTITDLSGEIEVSNPGEIGGLDFRITLPLA